MHSEIIMLSEKKVRHKSLNITFTGETQIIKNNKTKGRYKKEGDK